MQISFSDDVPKTDSSIAHFFPKMDLLEIFLQTIKMEFWQHHLKKIPVIYFSTSWTILCYFVIQVTSRFSLSTSYLSSLVFWLFVINHGHKSALGPKYRQNFFKRVWPLY